MASKRSGWGTLLRLNSPLSCLPLVLLSALPSAAQPADADLVLRNGRIWTASRPAAWVDALAIKGGRIVATGPSAAKRSGPGTEVIDLQGRLAIPGINDAHIHFLMGSLGLTQVDLTGICTLEAMQKQVAEFARANPNEAWITGRGWEYYCFPGARLPRKEDLDAVVPDRPVFLKAYDGHTGWANSKALRMAEVFKDTRFGGFGEIVRDAATGEPSGALKEGAMALVARHVPPPTRAQQLAALERGRALAASLGITSMQNASGNADEVALYAAMPRTLRLSVAMSAGKATAEDISAWTALREQYASAPEWLKVDAVKFVIDGVIESKTAAMLAPYADGSKDTGSPSWQETEFAAAIARVHNAGFQIYTHAIGDRGVRMTLDAYAAANAGRHRRDARHRIEHIETIHPDDIPRFATLGVLASMEPIHADPDTVEVWSKLVGPARLPLSFPWRTLEKAGARLVFSSDWPAAITINPWRGIHNAVNRRTIDGKPPGGWLPEQRVSLETALQAYTEGSAYASFEEKRKGVLAPGLLGDVVVLSQNLFEIDPMKIHATKALLTVVGGRVVYRDPAGPFRQR